MKDNLSVYKNYDNIFTLQHLHNSFDKCRPNVGWKDSVQTFRENSVKMLYDDYIKLNNGVYPELKKSQKIVVFERGKRREISPVGINDRVIQRTLCDYALVPVLSNSLIYDNGASLSGKGVNFTRNRIKYHLHNAIKEYGNNFYILLFDFKSYFDSIPHAVCKKILDDNFSDKRIVDITMDIIISYQLDDIRRNYKDSDKQLLMDSVKRYEGRGLCLGSQVSQIMALAVPNKIDHYIKDELGIKHYIRYMDDGMLLCDSKEILWSVLGAIKTIAAELGLKLNDAKTRIIPSSQPFVFMKRKYTITSTGKLIINLSHDSIVRERRKLKSLKHKLDDGIITLDDVYNSMQSWLATTVDINSHTSSNAMLDLYDDLFAGYKITPKWFKAHPGCRMKTNWRHK